MFEAVVYAKQFEVACGVRRGNVPNVRIKTHGLQCAGRWVVLEEDAPAAGAGGICVDVEWLADVWLEEGGVVAEDIFLEGLE